MTLAIKMMTLEKLVTAELMRVTASDAIVSPKPSCARIRHILSVHPDHQCIAIQSHIETSVSSSLQPIQSSALLQWVDAIVYPCLIEARLKECTSETSVVQENILMQNDIPETMDLAGKEMLLWLVTEGLFWVL